MRCLPSGDELSSVTIEKALAHEPFTAEECGMQGGRDMECDLLLRGNVCYQPSYDGLLQRSAKYNCGGIKCGYGNDRNAVKLVLESIAR